MAPDSSRLSISHPGIICRGSYQPISLDNGFYTLLSSEISIFCLNLRNVIRALPCTEFLTVLSNSMNVIMPRLHKAKSAPSPLSVLLLSLTHSLTYHFETVPTSKKLKRTTEMWLFKDFKVQVAQKTLWEKVKLLILSNFTFFYNVFLKLFFLQCVKMSVYGGTVKALWHTIPCFNDP